MNNQRSIIANRSDKGRSKATAVGCSTTPVPVVVDSIFASVVSSPDPSCPKAVKYYDILMGIGSP